MDSNLQSPPPDTSDTKTTFRKPSNDAANRKYRRRSPVSASSASEGSPQREQSSSPVFSRDNPAKGSEHRSRRKDDGREQNRDSNWSQHGRSSDSYRYSERQSSRSSRQDGYGRHDKHGDSDDRIYDRLSSRSSRESRGTTHSDRTREEREYGRSREYSRNVDKYSRDRYESSGHRSKDKESETSSLEHRKYNDKDSFSDRAGSGRRHADSVPEETFRDHRRRDREGRDEKRDYHRGSKDHKSDYAASHEESKGKRNGSSSGWESDKYGLKEGCKSGSKETYRDKDRSSKETNEQFEEEYPAKKPKAFSSSRDSDYCKDDVAAGKQSSSLQAQESGAGVTAGDAHAKDFEVANGINAAKVAAMKAAELVNKNLVGGGYMTADQKKKLLWGNKKSTTAEETGHHWDAALFGDRERQEKFNKLMGVKGDTNMEHKANNQEASGLLQAEKQKEVQLDLEKQYTAGLRRRDGRTVGLGL